MRHLIIGFSAAGANAAETLRRLCSDDEITVLDGEGESFYLRLDLEELFWGKPLAVLRPRPPAYWEEKGIVVLPERAVQLDLRERTVTTASGRILPYDRLLIATGASPRELPIAGRHLEGVTHYHTLGDVRRILALRERVQQVVIVGAGLLGLELARVAVAFGWKVTLVVRGGHVGSPTVDPQGSTRVLNALLRAGVSVLFHDEVVALEGKGTLQAARTRGGQRIEADLAVICAGVVPEVEFLAGTGLLTAGQLVVNERLETPCPHVYAAGDVAVVKTHGGRQVGCSTWAVASSQGRTAAANMCGANSPWPEDVLYNLDHLFDQEFALIGRWAERHLPGRTVHEVHAPEAYRAAVTRDGILESAFLLGSRAGDRRLRQLIAARARVDGDVEHLLDPALHSDDPA